jgi:hypothetical protein
MADLGGNRFGFRCYVGEAFVRHDGARWARPDAEGQRLGFKMMGVRTADGAFLNPIGRTMRLMENGKQDSVSDFYRALHTSAARP